VPNRLSDATSPYLQQHADNPVDWREWRPETLEEARRRDVPILLSVGYAACHWCHVMAHESFEDPETAALMNAGFVNIKVDREERPDLDGIYQQALALLGEQGGWPLTMFLTPAGEPYWGGTYFPPEPRYGRPSFRQVLETMQRIWRDERFKVDANRDQLRQALQRLAAPRPGEAPQLDWLRAAAEALAEEFDAVHGGLGGAPKFPQAPVLGFLWSAAATGGLAKPRRRVLHTLARICQGGIYDHLGGGFARYSVDAFWLVPHFEKMLYDNAQLLELLGEAWAATGDELFRARARETVAWLEREMLVDGAFAAALDADSEGEEGRFYVWSQAEIQEVLGEAAGAFELAYGVTRAGNWEGKNVLNRLHEPGLPADAAEAALLAACRERLRVARERRVRPARDDKLLTDWNGLMIHALAAAGRRLGERRWITLAATAFDALLARAERAGGLVHATRGERRLELAFLDDYANLARAAVGLFEATGEPRYLAKAEAWLERLDADYAATGGGYHLTPADGPELIVRPLQAQDGPTPSGNGTLALLAARLHLLTGRASHRERTLRVLRAFAGELTRSPFAHATLLRAALALERPVQIVVLGPEPDPQRAALVAAAHRLVPPDGLVLAPAADQPLPTGHPAQGKAMLAGRPTAYVCVGPTCLAPVQEPQDLAAHLAGLAG
jgi:uncharacterized protein YyaL (SSP411 family)